jgi:hypothetical protein
MYKKDLELEREWQALLGQLSNLVDKRPRNLEAVLFLVGVNELGHGARPFTKEEKQDLIHIAICKVLSYSGFYQLEGLDESGWPHWKLVKELPPFDLLEQEKLLKMHLLEYFQHQYGIRGVVDQIR